MRTNRTSEDPEVPGGRLPSTDRAVPVDSSVLGPPVAGRSQHKAGGRVVFLPRHRLPYLNPATRFRGTQQVTLGTFCGAASTLGPSEAIEGPRKKASHVLPAQTQGFSLGL